MFTAALIILSLLVLFIAICVTPWQAWLFAAAGGLVGYMFYRAFKGK